MQNRLRRQNSFTQLTAIGTAASAATGMVAVAALIITLIAAFKLQQGTHFITYPPVLDQIAKPALYVLVFSIVGFLIPAGGLIISLLVGTKAGPEQTNQVN